MADSGHCEGVWNSNPQKSCYQLVELKHYEGVLVKPSYVWRAPQGGKVS